MPSPSVERQRTGIFPSSKRLAQGIAQESAIFLFLPDAAAVAGDLPELQLGAAPGKAVEDGIPGGVFADGIRRVPWLGGLAVVGERWAQMRTDAYTQGCRGAGHIGNYYRLTGDRGQAGGTWPVAGSG